MPSMPLFEIDFGQPEAELDSLAIQRSFYEASSWTTVSSGRGMPFVVGRKGSGKSAIAARLEIVSKQDPNCCFIRFVPAVQRPVQK
jgi:hypothetical protein